MKLKTGEDDPMLKKGTKSRQTLKKCKFEEISVAIYVWFCEKRQKGIPLFGPILKEKAVMFYNEFENNKHDKVKQLEKKFVVSGG